MAIVVAAAVEYAARKEGARPWWGAERQTPFRISFCQTYGDGPVQDNESPWCNTITVRNSSRENDIDDVEVHLVKVTKVKPKRGGYSDVNLRLIERTSCATSFNLTPAMSRDVFFYRKMDKDAQKGEQISLGPLERPDGRRLLYGPGLYKIDIAVYGRDVPPAIASLAVGLDERGTTMHGAWQDDLPWPFSMRITTTVTAVQSSQSQPSTAP